MRGLGSPRCSTAQGARDGTGRVEAYRLLDDGREPSPFEHMGEHEARSDGRADEQDFGFESHGRTPGWSPIFGPDR